MPVPPEASPRPRMEWPLIIRVLLSIRMDEVAALQGAPFIGLCIAVPTLSASHLATAALVVAGNICLVAHVFTLNDWAGIDSDLLDPQRANRTFVGRGVSRPLVGLLSAALLLTSFGLFAAVGRATLLAAVTIAVLSALYSSPAVNMKAKPFFNSMLHLLGGAVHFLLGYTAFASIDLRAVMVGVFFGLVFTAGHFTHEARDYEGDLLNKIRTNAVVFGRTSSFAAGLILFGLAYALLAGLAISGVMPSAMAWASGLYLPHLIASIAVLRMGVSFDRLKRLQILYRISFAVVGIAMVAAALTS